MSDDLNKVTNLAYLIDISKGNKSFITEMIEIFLTENPLEINSLESAIEEKDFEHIKSSAHKMKSTIPFVGIDRLIEKDLVEIENLASENKGIEQIKTLFLRIKKICSTAAEELRSN